MPLWRQEQKRFGRRVVVTNGCFDVLHTGHLRYLCAARQLGDVLIVGINGDDSVRALKGPSRPLNSEADRAELLGALKPVDAVVIFPEPRAVRFLELVQPDIYVKGGDYTEDQLDRDEVAVIKKAGGVIRILPLVPGKSTSAMIKKAGGTL
ncbi:MAG: adenylyltransferase/cytidyltransferase family protein [Methylacidiphilales bacterium]|nr:adenylyltransferase/cytidyltransferase family protein [Candidatus Methylacidiphilales bacterium]